MNKYKFLDKKYLLIYLIVFSVIVICISYFLIYKKFEGKVKINLSNIEAGEKEISKEISSNQYKLKKTTRDWNYDKQKEFVDSRIIEKEIPESWEKYENESTSFYYPKDKYEVSITSNTYDDSVTLEGKAETGPRKADEWTTENWNHEEWRRDGLAHDIDINIKNLDSYSFEEGISERVLEGEWFGVSNSRLRKYGMYQINGKEVSLYFIENVEESELSYGAIVKKPKAQSFPRKEYRAIYKGELNLYVIEAGSDVNDSAEDFVNTIESIIGSLEEKKAVTKKSQGDIPIGGSKRLVRQEKSEAEIGELYLDASKGAPSVGNSSSSKKIIIIADALKIDVVNTIPELEELINTSNIEILYLPTFSQGEPFGPLPVKALICADKKGKFIEYKNKLHELAGKQLKYEDSTNTIKGIAKDLGLDEEAFYKCTYSAETERYYNEFGKKLWVDIGVQYDPTVVLIQDGKRVGEFWGSVGVGGLIKQMKKNPDSIWY